MALYDVAGLTGRVDLPVPLVVRLIPRSQTKQRPGIARQRPGYWVQHETGNPLRGADALMHCNWLHNGAGGATLSFHFVVDDKAIYQMLPVDEVSWQAADGDGPGNMSGVSCELCINAGIDVARSRANAEALAAAVMRGLNLGEDRVRRHWDFNQAQSSATRHHCPDRMMSEGYWPTFVANVGKLITGGGGGITPEYAAPVAPPPIDGRDQTVNGIPFWTCDRSVTAVTSAPALQYAKASASPVRPPFRAGETFRVAFAVEGDAFGGSRWWYVLPSGARVPQAACTPKVEVKK